MNHYTYQTTCKQTGRFYIGAHSCQNNPHEDKRYLGSGVWFNGLNKESLEKAVITIHANRKEALNQEKVLLRMHSNNPLCMNKNRNKPVVKTAFGLDEDVAKELTIYILEETLKNPRKKITRNELVNRALRKLLGMKQ